MNAVISRNPEPPARTAQPRLRVGGLGRLTTIDYPDQLAAVVFCQGCPWRCRYCHNPDLIEPEGDPAMRWEDCLNWLQQRRGLLDAVVFSGGEPTLQQGLGSAMQQARDLGYRVGLHSAGCYPSRLKPVLSKTDWIGFDIKALAEDYASITRVPGSGSKAWQSLDLVLQSGVDYEVRLTVHSALSNLDSLRTLVEQLSQKGVRNLALQASHTERMSDPTCGPSSTDWLKQLADFAREHIDSVQLRH